MLTGEKIHVIYREKRFIPCTKNHALTPTHYLSTHYLKLDIERPARPVKSPMITTSDVS